MSCLCIRLKTIAAVAARHSSTPWTSLQTFRLNVTDNIRDFIIAMTNGPLGGSVDVPLSNAALLIVSACGFVALAATIFSVIVVRLKTSAELDGEIGNDEVYEDRLKRSDVSTLTRAERRARAHVIMKEKRRMERQGQDGRWESPTQPQQHATMSRKERQKAAKAQEKTERKLFEADRLEQQRLAQDAARKDKEQREVDEARRQQEEATRKKKEMKAREEATLKEWDTFLSTPTSSMSVDQFADLAKAKKYVNVGDIADEFGIPASTIGNRIKTLLKEERLTGVSDNEECFLFLDHDELVAIASAVIERGSVTPHDVSAIVEETMMQSISGG
ncbi:hypothetical protein MPSEU_000487300 [Mayamaea pseudoterrestris]|nr:hypothetical protein MPSEU_000487300 [Mayamaea pseudoterrestris]